MKLRNLLANAIKGTPARPPLTAWKPLEDLDEPDGILRVPGKELTPADVDEIKARFLAAQKSEPVTVVGQCTARTKAGSQCKNPAVAGSTRCVLPSHQRM